MKAPVRDPTAADEAPPLRWGARSDRLLVAWLVVLSLHFLLAAAVDLGNVRPVSLDEPWILSVSHKLATQGVMGTDMYAGFFNADRHWFLNLPGQYLMHAAVFQVTGSGIAQGRWVSVAAALVILWVAGILARRWYGPGVAALATGLLVFWRSDLVGQDLGIPLLSVARSLRYDVTPVAWMWLTILGLDSCFRRPTTASAFLTGLAAGAAVLTQFFGACVVLVAGLAWLWQPAGVRPGTRFAVWMSAGFLLVLSPYVAYVLTNWTDVVGQVTHTATLQRIPSFSVPGMARTLMGEPARFAGLLKPDIGRGMALAGTWPALAYLYYRLRRGGAAGDRLLWLSFVVPAALLATLEVTKGAIYAVVLLVPLCLVLALGAVRWIDWCGERKNPLSSGARLLAGGLLVLVFMEGVGVYWYDRRLAASVSPYEQVGARIDAQFPARAVVAGSPKWWWPLRRHSYTAVHSLALQWQTSRDRDPTPVSLGALMRNRAIRFIVVDDLVRLDVERYPAAFRDQWRSFIEQCTHLERAWTDRMYGRFAVLAVTAGCAEGRQDGRQ